MLSHQEVDIEKLGTLVAQYGELLSVDLRSVEFVTGDLVAVYCNQRDALAICCYNKILLSQHFLKLSQAKQRAVIAHECAHLAQKRLQNSSSMRYARSSEVEAEANLAAGKLLAGQSYNCVCHSQPDALTPWGCVGHFWSVWLAYLNALEEPKTAFKLALFCWMPDQVDELDAADLYKNYLIGNLARSAALSREFVKPEKFIELDNQRTAELNYLQSIHKGIHCLNGGVAEKETILRASIIQNKTLNLMLRGVAHHAFGDSFAHRKLDSPGTMYSAGLGHAGDLTHPDEVSHAKAGLTYKAYLAELQKQACLWTGKAPVISIESLMFAVNPMLHQSCQVNATPINISSTVEALGHTACGTDEEACANHLKKIASTAIGKSMDMLWYNPIRGPKRWNEYYMEHVAQIESVYPCGVDREQNKRMVLKTVVDKAKEWSLSTR